MENRCDSTDEEFAIRVAAGSRRSRRKQRVLDEIRSAVDDAAVLETGPTGIRAFEPLVSVTRDDRTALYPSPAAERLESLVETLERGRLPTEDAAAVVDHDPAPASLPTPESGPLSVGRRRVLGRCGWIEPATVPDERAAELALEEPEEAWARVREPGLLGRGRGDWCADEPLVDEWDRAVDAASDDRDPVVVVNANDSDARNETDRTLLEGAPGEVLDGALAVAELVGAEDVVVYCNEADDGARERVREAARAAEERLEELGRESAPEVVVGPNRYIAGEPTMALEAMEGTDRLEARLRPPSPAEHGLYGRPTIVHTPRTVAQLRRAMLRPDEFDDDDADPGTRLLTATGDVDAAATVELPTGGSLEDVREAVDVEGRFKMACVGGQFGGFTRSLAHSPSAPALEGAGLGTEGAVELLNDDRCVLATAGRRANFAMEENCGRCVTCREGSKQLTNMLRDIYGGEYQDATIRELTRVMGETSICRFGRSAVRPAVTGMSEFEREVAAHAEGRCPSGECEIADGGAR
ncbi:NADH-ubiquinone oxidoreductase-F iron-sulfur binding region domain-containing protein [Natronococcus jeotgali]|uniref:Respiratory-chain NADH dehydrogenase domain 51 kDa subunit n=1 Tax=Natronococcus jeotgali DSM 18795 TaxID=1227498 RepID=L9X3J8_9EURY|nr:NADH-ubiquinone oxidoreductase-F iron-sulfur binding region domain-containing protein [Natronococcus jeotgali]ELY55158.1 respiratory-chain NADH dehydrogenase domain 51 kDa subunit [Natronococcus jeotgali DSM 18795]